MLNCGSGGTGRRAGLRIQWVTPCGFESRLPHTQLHPPPHTQLHHSTGFAIAFRDRTRTRRSRCSGGGVLWNIPLLGRRYCGTIAAGGPPPGGRVSPWLPFGRAAAYTITIAPTTRATATALLSGLEMRRSMSAICWRAIATTVPVELVVWPSICCSSITRTMTESVELRSTTPRTTRTSGPNEPVRSRVPSNVRRICVCVPTDSPSGRAGTYE